MASLVNARGHLIHEHYLLPSPFSQQTLAQAEGDLCLAQTNTLGKR